jgi:hypothetical protein
MATIVFARRIFATVDVSGSSVFDRKGTDFRAAGAIRQWKTGKFQIRKVADRCWKPGASNQRCGLSET